MCEARRATLALRFASSSLSPDAREGVSVRVGGAPAAVCETSVERYFEADASRRTDGHNRLAEAGREKSRDCAGRGRQVSTHVRPVGVAGHFAPITISRVTSAPGMDFDNAAGIDLQSGKSAGG